MGAAAVAKHHSADWPSSVHNLDNGYATVHLTLPSQKRRKLLIKLPPAVCSIKGRPSPALKKAVVQQADMTSPRVAQTTKSKRVRTGCLTCRTRHLKCDEGTPDCGNCRKSNRVCKRGVRLNFIDLTCKEPPYVPPTESWTVEFLDESRVTASEYQGGMERYPLLENDHPDPCVKMSPRATTNEPESMSQPQTLDKPIGTPKSTGDGHLATSTPLSQYATYQVAAKEHPARVPSRSSNASEISVASGMLSDHTRQDNSSGGASAGASTVRLPSSAEKGISSFKLHHVAETPEPSSYAFGENTSERRLLDSPHEMHLMQTYINEVGVWMDCLDSKRHFSQIVPYQALSCPMLLNALLSCGARRLTLTDSSLNEKALFYYDTATTQLLRSLQNPERDTAECAATAVVLNIYEVMSEKPQSRMSHIAGARALIRECGWNAQSEGIGGACFWFNVGLELSSCLAFNYRTTWDADDWGLDLSFVASAQSPPSTSSGVSSDEAAGESGGEELWARRMFYIVAKVTDLRASMRSSLPRSGNVKDVPNDHYSQWHHLKRLCESWNASVPRSMQPLGYLAAERSDGKTVFPKVWIIKQPAIIGRLLYHMAQYLLAQCNPGWSTTSEESHMAQQHHALQVCGLVAHNNDPGIACVAFKALGVVAEVLSDPEQQHAALILLGRIHHQSDWKLRTVIGNLKRLWGWPADDGDNNSDHREERVSQSQHQTPTKQESESHIDMSSLPLMGNLYVTQSSQDEENTLSAQAVQTQSRTLPTPATFLPSQQGLQHDQRASNWHSHHAQQRHSQQEQLFRHYHQQQQHGLEQDQQRYQHQQQMMTLAQSSPHPSPMPQMQLNMAHTAPVNPLQVASFDLPRHPYQNWYEPPASDSGGTTSYQQHVFAHQEEGDYGHASPFSPHPRPSTG